MYLVCAWKFGEEGNDEAMKLVNTRKAGEKNLMSTRKSKYPQHGTFLSEGHKRIAGWLRNESVILFVAKIA